MAGSNGHSSEEPRNPHVHHEPGDVNARAVTESGLAMAALVIVFSIGLWGVFEYLKHRVTEMALPLSPAAMVNAQKQPPEPRLQPHAAQDMRQMQSDENKIMQQYAWIDPDKGIVRIPVERAMDLIAQRGLPAGAAAPAGKKK